MSGTSEFRALVPRKPRERINLTDRKIASIKPEPGRIIDIADAQVRGLHLRVHPTGARTWSVMLRHANRPDAVTKKLRRFTIPNSSSLTLAQARSEAQKLLPQLREGHDPISQRRLRQAAHLERGIATFADLISAYERIAIPQKKRTRGWPKSRAVIERVFKSALSVPIDQLSKPDLQIGLDLTAQTAPVSVRVAWEALSPVLRWAERRDYLPFGLRERVAPPERSVRNKRDTLLSDDELRAVWTVLDVEGYPFGYVYKLLLLTGQRRSEVAEMTWQEVNFDSATWTIPKERTKQSRDQVVPLSGDAIAVLREVESLHGRRRPLVFASSPVRTKAERPKDSVILKAGGLPLSNWDRVHKRILRDSKTAGWTKHDMRRVVATGMGTLGIAPHVIEHVLGHADPLASSGLSTVAGVYMRYDYGKEKREALEKWATSLRDILADRSNVVPLVRRRART
jgi:integrase